MRYNKNINRSVRLWEETKMANEKILVVDDDKNICELLRLYLVKEGYNVTMVHDGSAALTEFDKLHPDLVLLDELDDVVVMAEVKTRRVSLDCTTLFFPEEAVDAQKQRRYRRIASCYLMEHYPLKAIRFDAVGVTIRGGHIAEIEHQYNAFDWQVS